MLQPWSDNTIDDHACVMIRAPSNGVLTAKIVSAGDTWQRLHDAERIVCHVATEIAQFLRAKRARRTTVHVTRL